MVGSGFLGRGRFEFVEVEDFAKRGEGGEWSVGFPPFGEAQRAAVLLFKRAECGHCTPVGIGDNSLAVLPNRRAQFREQGVEYRRSGFLRTPSNERIPPEWRPPARRCLQSDFSGHRLVHLYRKWRRAVCRPRCRFGLRLARNARSGSVLKIRPCGISSDAVEITHARRSASFGSSNNRRLDGWAEVVPQPARSWAAVSPRPPGLHSAGRAPIHSPSMQRLAVFAEEVEDIAGTQSGELCEISGGVSASGLFASGSISRVSKNTSRRRAVMA